MDSNVQELVNRIKVEDQASQGFLSAREAAKAFTDQIASGSAEVRASSAAMATSINESNQSVAESHRKTTSDVDASIQQIISNLKSRAAAHKITADEEIASLAELRDAHQKASADWITADTAVNEAEAAVAKERMARSEMVKDKILADSEQLLRVAGRNAELLKGAFGIAGTTAAIVSAVELFRQMIDEASKFDSAMARIKVSVENQGKSFADARQPISDFVDEMSRATRFDATDLLNQIAELTSKGHDWADSVRVVNVASNVAASQGKDLGTVVNALSLAWQGNSLGLRQLGLSMDDLRDPTKTFNGYLQELWDRSQNAAKNGVDPLRGSIGTLGAAWKQLSTDIGESAEGPFSDIAKQLTAVVDALDDAVKASDKGKSSWDAFTDSITKGTGPVRDFVKALKDLNDFGQPVADWLNESQKNVEGIGRDLHNQLANVTGFIAWMTHDKSYNPNEYGYPDKVDPSSLAPASGPAASQLPFVEQSAALAAAQQAGVNPQIFMRLLAQEGGGGFGSPEAVSSAGAIGPGQFMPETAQDMAREMGVSLTDVLRDPATNLKASALYLADLLREFHGDYTKAVAAYNAGPGAVEKYGGVPPFAQTLDYAHNILGISPGSGAAAPQVSQGGDARMGTNAAKAAATELRGELEKITHETIPEQIKALEDLLATHKLTADERTRIEHTLYEDEQKLDKQRVEEKKKADAAIASSERDRFSQSSQFYALELSQHKGDIDMLEHVRNQWENLGATIHTTGTQAEHERAEIHKHVVELDAEIAKMQALEPAMTGFVGTVNGVPVNQSQFTGGTNANPRGPSPITDTDLTGALSGPLLSQEVAGIQKRAAAVEENIRAEGGLKTAQDQRLIASIEGLKLELQGEISLDQAQLSHMTTSSQGYKELTTAIAAARAELGRLNDQEQKTAQQTVNDARDEAKAVQAAYDGWANRAEAAIQRLVENGSGGFRSLGDAFKQMLREMEDELIKSVIFKLFFPQSTQGQSSWSDIFKGVAAAPFGGIAPTTPGSAPTGSIDQPFHVIIDSAGASFLDSTIGNPIGVQGLVPGQGILAGTPSGPLGILGMGEGVITPGSPQSAAFTAAAAAASAQYFAAQQTQELTQAYIEAGMSPADAAQMAAQVAPSSTGDAAAALKKQHGVGAVAGGALEGYAVGSAIAPGNPWASGLGAIGGAAGEYFGGPVGEAVGSFVGASVGSLFGPHWGPASNYPDRGPGAAQYQAWLKAYNGGPGDIGYQIEDWLKSADPKSLTPDQLKVYNEFKALGGSNGDIGIANEHDGVFTLGSGVKISVAQLEQDVTDFQNIEANGLAPGAWTISRSYPDFNISTIAPVTPSTPPTSGPPSTIPVPSGPRGPYPAQSALPGQVSGMSGTIAIHVDADMLTAIVSQRLQAQSSGYGYYAPSAQRNKLV